MQSDIEDMIRSFEEEDAFFSDIATVSWLRVYKQFLQHWPVQPQNETQFVQVRDSAMFGSMRSAQLMKTPHERCKCHGGKSPP